MRRTRAAAAWQLTAAAGVSGGVGEGEGAGEGGPAASEPRLWFY